MNLVDKTTVLRTIGYIIAICIIQMYYSLHYIGLPGTYTPKGGQRRSKRRTKLYKGGQKRRRLVNVKFSIWRLFKFK